MFSGILGDLFGWVLTFIMSVGGAGVDNLKITTYDEDTGAITAIGEAINNLWDYFKIIGIGMTLIYFVLELNQRFALEGRDVTIKTVGVPFLKFMVAIAILFNSGSIISWVFSWGNAAYEAADGFISSDSTSLVNQLEDAGVAMNNATAEVHDALKSWSGSDGGSMAEANRAKVLGEWLGTGAFAGLKLAVSIVFVICGVILLLANIVASVVWTYKAFAYKLEVLYRIGVTPVAMADVYSGQNSGAIRWIKGCIGLVLYGMSLVILPKLANVLAMTQLTEALKMCFDISGAELDASVGILFIVRLAACIAAPFAAIGCLSAVRQLIKEATG